MTLPKIPDGKDWSEATWRAGLDEAVRLVGWLDAKTWDTFIQLLPNNWEVRRVIIAHATTLLDAGIVKPVVSEGEAVWNDVYDAYCTRDGKEAAIAVIQSALDKAREGQ